MIAHITFGMHFYIGIVFAGLIGIALGKWHQSLVNEGLSINKEYLKVMREKLQNLREQVIWNSGWADNIKKDVAQGKINYSDLGTTEEELTKLGCRLSYKERAIQCLNMLRAGDGTHEFERDLKWIRECISKGGLSLQELGTNEAELISLPAINVEKVARHYLGWARNHLGNLRACKSWILWALRTKLITPETIGIRDEEMRTFGITGITTKT